MVNPSCNDPNGSIGGLTLASNPAEPVRGIFSICESWGRMEDGCGLSTVNLPLGGWRILLRWELFFYFFFLEVIFLVLGF